MNSYEKNLLFKLGNRQFDGTVGPGVVLHKTITYETLIVDGEPMLIQRAESEITLNNGRCMRDGYGEKHLMFTSNEEKIDFLRRYGWLIEDDEAKAFSSENECTLPRDRGAQDDQL